MYCIGKKDSSHNSDSSVNSSEPSFHLKFTVVALIILSVALVILGSIFALEFIPSISCWVGFALIGVGFIANCIFSRFFCEIFCQKEIKFRHPVYSVRKISLEGGN